MNLTTKHSIGDRVYWVKIRTNTKNGIPCKNPITELIGPLTIGYISIVLADSPGLADKDGVFNYSAQKYYREEYMCVETGIGTGTVYKADELFRDVLYNAKDNNA